MPYYVHFASYVLETEADTNGLAAFPTRAEAAAHIATQPTDLPLKITFIVSYYERRDWRERERGRFRDGTYFPISWGEAIGNDDTDNHFVHLSLGHPGLIAYTASDEHGVQDRQTRVKPGRYLKQFHPTLSDAEIRAYVSQCQGSSLELHITTDPDEIEAVYVGGPSSCMSHRVGREIKSSDHPTRVYGGPGSSLALAYYGDKDKASGRAIVWPSEMRYSRIYGGTETLRHLLENAGYESGSMNGATIRAIQDGDLYIVPYVDGIEYGKFERVDGHDCIRLGSGNINLQRVDGYSAAERAEEEQDEDDHNTFYCDSCEEDRPNNEYHGSTRQGAECNSCWESNSTECYRCSERVRDSEMGDSGEMLDGDWYCDSCASHIVGCIVQDCENCWIERDLNSDVQAQREADGQTEVCPECAEAGIYCTTCGQFHDRDEPDTDEPYKAICPDCRVLIKPEGQLRLMYVIPPLSDSCSCGLCYGPKATL
jgi:hypothetical protein